jgi:hypothetical protein
MRIENVDFGRIDAESDAKLKEYFVDTGVLRRLARGERQFVIGRKGSGKTALFQQADSTFDRVTLIRLEFSDYAWEKHKAIKELGLPDENAYTASWLFTFLMAACKEWRKSPDKSVSKPADEVYLRVYGKEDPGTLELLVDKLRRLRRVDLPNAGDLGGLGGFELEELPEGATLARAANVWNERLLQLASDLFPKAPVTILVDRLDDGWDASEEIRNMLAGAIKATRTLNLRFGVEGLPRPVIIFLRSDIFAELRFNDKNKIGGDTEYLEWNDFALLNVINARIAKSLDIPHENAWENVFSPEQMRQRAFISSYLLKRTMQRPRDIIAFCIYCREAALKEGHERVETSDVYEAERAYSRHIYDELVDEMHKQIEDVATLFKSLRLLGYMRFRFPEWVEAVKRISPAAGEVEAERRLKILFDHGVVGVPKVGGKGGGTSFEFVYQDRYLDPSFDGDLVVHPSLRKQLDLKDAKAGAGADDGGTQDYDQLDFASE